MSVSLSISELSESVSETDLAVHRVVAACKTVALSSTADISSSLNICELTLILRINASVSLFVLKRLSDNIFHRVENVRIMSYIMCNPTIF